MNNAWMAGRLILAGVFLVGIASGFGFSLPWSSLVDRVEFAPTNAVNATDDDPDNANPLDVAKDWQRPDITLFVTGRQHGYIEPCGCITLARQKGGLMRRHRVQKILQERGWDLLAIDAGNQVRRFGQQPVIKLGKTYEALCREMKYAMIGLGPDDLKLPSTDIAQTMINVVGDDNPFTCANIEVVDESLTKRFLVLERGGKKIGVTMVVGDEYLEELAKRDGLVVRSVADAMAMVVPQLAAAKCDINLLVAFTDMEKSRALAKAYPLFDLLVTAGGAGDPTLQPEVVENGGDMTPMIQVGVKGMYVGLVGVYFKGGKTEIKYERVALEHQFKDTEEMKKIFLSYQERLKSLWLANALTDIIPREHPSGHQFVGSSECADCHDVEYEIWEDGVDGDGGPHEKATRDLEQNPNDDRVWVQRQFDPECMSCHATGWNPQNYYPYKTGLTNIQKQPHLLGNGCENCHGPGSAHVDMEKRVSSEKVDEGLRKRLTEEMRVTLAEARASACKECHDLDNSPDFLLEGGFDTYWPKIEHGNQ